MLFQSSLVTGVALFSGIILGNRIKKLVLDKLEKRRQQKLHEKEEYYDNLLSDQLNICGCNRADVDSQIYRWRPDEIDVPYLLNRLDEHLSSRRQKVCITDVTPNTFQLFCQAKMTLIKQYEDLTDGQVLDDDTKQLLASWVSNQQIVQSYLSKYLPAVVSSLIIDGFYDSDDFYRIYTWTNRSTYIIVYLDRHVNQTVVHYIKM